MSGFINKLLDYNNYTFKVNWASGVTIFGLMFSSIFLYIQNEGLKDDVASGKAKDAQQEEVINTLETTVNTLQGSMETVNSTIRAFTDNPPSALEAKIQGLEKIIGIYHGGNNFNQPAPTSFPSGDTTLMGN